MSEQTLKPGSESGRNIRARILYPYKSSTNKQLNNSFIRQKKRKRKKLLRTLNKCDFGITVFTKKVISRIICKKWDYYSITTPYNIVNVLLKLVFTDLPRGKLITINIRSGSAIFPKGSIRVRDMILSLNPRHKKLGTLVHPLQL